MHSTEHHYNATVLTKEQEAEFRLHPERVHAEQFKVRNRHGVEEMEYCDRRVELFLIGDKAFLTCYSHGHVAWADTELP